MLLRHDYEIRERQILAPYAALSSETRGRVHPERQCEFRTDFQRDRDRIIHTSAFRRLEYKTQVFVNHEGDYYRTRLTHTLEVAQISRNFARSFNLNEDLAEAIALAHDLGHTPFGHSGEDAMNELMKTHGGFEHNHQSLRVVTLLEHRYADFEGLNLTFEVLEGIAKHFSEYDRPNIREFKNTGYPAIEAQIVNVADEIAYLTHDLDDGLTSGLLTREQLKDIPLWHKTMAHLLKDTPNINERLIKYQMIRRLINLFVTDLLYETEKRIHAKKIVTRDDVRKNGKNLVGFSGHLETEMTILKTFLFKNLYRHPKVKQMSDTAKTIVANLFKKFKREPLLLPKSYQAKIKKDNKLERHICDYIAGMTDRFALSEHARLCE